MTGAVCGVQMLSLCVAARLRMGSRRVALCFVREVQAAQSCSNAPAEARNPPEPRRSIAPEERSICTGTDRTISSKISFGDQPLPCTLRGPSARTHKTRTRIVQIVIRMSTFFNA